MSTRYPRRARLTTSDAVGLRTGRGSSGDAEAIHTTSPRTPGNRLVRARGSRTATGSGSSCVHRTSKRCDQECSVRVGGATAKVGARVMVIGFNGEVVTRTDDLPADAAGPEEDCRECGHTMVSDDAIAVRFCRASWDGALPRGCVCIST